MSPWCEASPQKICIFAENQRLYFLKKWPPGDLEFCGLLGGHPGGIPVIQLANVHNTYKHVPNAMRTENAGH